MDQSKRGFLSGLWGGNLNNNISEIEWGSRVKLTATYRGRYQLGKRHRG